MRLERGRKEEHSGQDRVRFRARTRPRAEAGSGECGEHSGRSGRMDSRSNGPAALKQPDNEGSICRDVSSGCFGLRTISILAGGYAEQYRKGLPETPSSILFRKIVLPSTGEKAW